LTWAKPNKAHCKSKFLSMGKLLRAPVEMSSQMRHDRPYVKTPEKQM